MATKSRSEIIYRIARTRKDLEQAFSLVYREYASRGYIPKHYKSKIRLSLYNALPSTTTFIGEKDGKIIATVTLIPDSPIGLPMDKIYKKEVDTLRKKNLRVAECSQLSLDSKLFPKGWFSLFNFDKLIFLFKLFKIILHYGFHYERLDEFCIAVNPRHQSIYNFMGFQNLGGLKYYGSVNKAPAIAKHLFLPGLKEKIRKTRKGLYKVFYEKAPPPNTFENRFIMTPADLEYFFLKKSDHFKKASKKDLACIKSCYPQKEVKKVFDKIESAEK